MLYQNTWCRMTADNTLQKDMEESDSGLMWVTDMAFSWRDWGKSRKPSVEIADFPADILNWTHPEALPACWPTCVYPSILIEAPNSFYDMSCWYSDELHGPSSIPSKSFLFFTASRSTLRPTQPPVQWVPESLSPGSKAAGAWRWPHTSI
jgi:hypothetical protein